MPKKQENASKGVQGGAIRRNIQCHQTECVHIAIHGIPFWCVMRTPRDIRVVEAHARVCPFMKRHLATIKAMVSPHKVIWIDEN